MPMLTFSTESAELEAHCDMEVAIFASASPYEHPIVIYFIVSMTRS